MKGRSRGVEAHSAAEPKGTAPQGADRRWSPRWYAVLLALLPLGRTALDHRWLFDGPSRDAWIYYGYFRFARIYLQEAPSRYYSSRLSVILPGYFLRHLLPAVPANLVLHLALYACAILAFYRSTRVFSGSRGALLASLVLGGQPFFLKAIGSNYAPGFGITYYLVALVFVVAAATGTGGRRASGLLAAAGAAAVAMVAANIFYSLYVPLLIAQYLAINRRRARLQLLPAAAWAAAGGAVAFALLDGVSWFWGHGSKLFLRASVVWLLEFSQHPSSFKHPFATWGPRAGWLVFPVAVLCGSFAMLLRRWMRQASLPLLGGRSGLAAGVPLLRTGGDDAEAGALGTLSQIYYVAAFAVLAALELEPHGVTLQFAFYAVLLLPPAGQAFAAQLAPLVDRLPPRVFGGLAVLTAALLMPLRLGGAPLWEISKTVPIALALAMGAVAVAVIAARLRGLPATILVIVSTAASLQLAHRAAFSENQPSQLPDVTGEVEAGGYADSTRFFCQLDAMLSRLRAVDPTLRLRLWYSMDEENGLFYDTLASSWRLCARLVTPSFPNLAGGKMCDRQAMQPEMKIAILSQLPPPAAVATAERSLQSIGLGARWLSATSIPGPVKPISLLVFETTARPAENTSPPR